VAQPSVLTLGSGSSHCIAAVGFVAEATPLAGLLGHQRGGREGGGSGTGGHTTPRGTLASVPACRPGLRRNDRITVMRDCVSVRASALRVVAGIDKQVLAKIRFCSYLTLVSLIKRVKSARGG